MAAMEWSFVEDGSLSVGEQTVDLAYHPKLNTVLAVTEEPGLRVLDVNSGVTLQKSTLSAHPGSNITCQYISEVDQVFLTDGHVVGLRKDLSGVLLLESALQTAVTKADDHVVVELPHSEASQLLACMMKPQRPGLEFWDEVQNELQEGLQNCKVNSADHTYHKINKWATVVLRLPHCALRSVCKTLLTELRRSNQHIPGLSIAAGIMDRLQSLYPESNPSLGNQAVDRAQMYSEAARRDTFSTWPHMNYKWALPEPMAQAGFYHQPTSAGDDRAMCFTCSVCLVCWEPTDEPWSEHERHSPNCPFVRGEPTENVPLFTTLASGPAHYHAAEGNQKIAGISASSCSHLMATSSRHGSISIWNVAHQLKLVTNFTVDPKDPVITGKTAAEETEGKPKVIEAWTEETSQTEIKSIPPGTENNTKPEPGNKPVDDKEDVQQIDLEKDPITKSSDREENYGSIEVIEVGGAWRFPEDGPSTDLKTVEDIPLIKPIVTEPPLSVQETSSSCAIQTTPSKDLIVSSLCVVAGMESKTAPPAQSSINPNTSQPNSPSKHIADIDNVAPPCLIAGVSLCSPKEAPHSTPSEQPGTQKNIEVEELAPSSGDDAGLGVDITNRKFIYADSFFGDVVDSRSNSPVEDAPSIPAAAVHQRHCLLVYRTSPKVKETASSKTVSKAKGNLYKTSAMYSLPTLAMSEILEMEEEQQALVEEPIGLEELSTEQVSSGGVVGESSTTSSNSKASIANEKAVQCVDLPAAVQRDDLWISSIVPCLDRQHILVVVGPHEGHLQNSGTASNQSNKCNTVQSEISRNEISQQNDLNKGSAFDDDDEDREDKPSDASSINQSFNKPFAKFFSENMPNEGASGGPTVEDIAIGDSECMKPFAKFFSENPSLAQNSTGNGGSNDFVPQDSRESDSGNATNPFAKLFPSSNDNLGSSGKTDSRFFPRKPHPQQDSTSISSDKPFAKYFNNVDGEGDNHSSGGYVLVYKLHCVDSMVAIVEEPVYIHSMGDTCKSFKKVVPLPTEICDLGSDEEIDVKPDVIPQQTENLSWEAFDESDSKGTQNEPALGKFAALTDVGKVIIFDAATFNVLSTITPSNLQSPKLVDRTNSDDRFIAMMYCTGMERLCVCSSSGHVSFVQLLTRETNRAIKRSKRVDKADADLETDAVEDVDAGEEETGDEYLTNSPLTQENLLTMRLLTQFETLVPRFSATVPPCWAEIQQEQQQRRHPQHLHQRQQGDATQHTRTWKLQPNGSKDHLFELVLPKACCVGHVDIKFTLHPSCSSPPKIQLTLLRQSGSQCLKIERETDAMNIKSTPVDAQINFNMDSPASEPKEQNVDVTSHEDDAGTASMTGPHFRKDFNFAEDSLMKSVFLRQHRDDIVCGPCDLECFVDMPSHTGVVTLTSRELMLSKNRSFLLHICAQDTPGGDAGGGKGTDGTPFLPVLQSTVSSSAAERLTAGSMRKETERYHGCDWVQELSITIRRTKKVNVPKDRLQRVMMLESKVFHNNLVEAVTGTSTDSDSSDVPSDSYTKELGLEILCWIAGVQICEPLRSSNTVTLIETVQKHLQSLIKTCYLDSDRSIAHKCSRLLALCIGCTMRWKNPGGYDSFRLSLLQSLLHWLPVLPCATSAGALRWFFTLLNMVKQVNAESTSQACVALLTLVAKNLEERALPAHSILRARFGLYGTPLDPVLFDIEPAIPVAKSASKPAGVSTSPYHQGVVAAPMPPGGGTMPSSGSTFGSWVDINMNQVGASKTTRDSSAASLGGAHFMCGLLEVEPLHFMCCSTSDGTYVERIGAGHESIASAIAMSAGASHPGESFTGGPSAALASLSSAMASAEQQLQMLQHKTHALIKLHQQKHKLEQKLQETSNSNSLPSQGYTEVFPATPKNTPFFMTPPLTPPNESTMQFGQSALWDVPDMYFPGMSPYITKFPSKGSKAAPGTPKGKGKLPDIGRSGSEAIQTNPTLVRNLLNPPQSHVLVIDRMHSGARRFAVLDFGRPILLTDIYIPSCSDLASLSVDVWNLGEEQDGRRLAVALDIGTKDLVMNDLLPPAVCRYLKLTVVGKYGGNAVRSKIPLGVFYGHTFFSTHEQITRDGQDSDSGFSDGQQTQQEQYLNLALAVQEDIQCRYSLACNRLERLLNNVDVQSGPAAFMRSEKMDGTSDIHRAYQECMQLQQQLNVVQRTIGRLQQSISPSTITQGASSCTSVQAVRQASSDELRIFCEYLLDTLLGMTKSADPLPNNLHRALNMETCKALFKHLGVMGTPQLRLRTGSLLVRVCSSQYWWGEFLASSLNEFFNSDQNLVFPQDRVFILLASLGQKSLVANNSVLEHLLTLLAKLLSPLLNGQSGFAVNAGPLDLSLVGWVLLFLSRTLDHTVGSSATSTTATGGGSTEGDDQDENGASGGIPSAGASSKGNGNATTDKDKGGNVCSSRWDFMTSNGQTMGGHHTSGGVVNRSHLQSRIQSKLKKQLQLHKEQLTQLQSMHKAIQAKAVEEGKDNDPMVQVQIKKKLQQHASKHLRDILRIRRITERNLRARGFLAQPAVSQDKPTDSPLPEVQLPRQSCIPVLQGLMNLLLAMDFTCHVDLFLVTCKVLARIANATRPAITLSEIATSEQLTKLLLLCVSSEHNQGMSSWGGPWASHAITCLLQDILEGERLYPFSEDFHIPESSIAVSEDASDLDSDLTGDVIGDDEAGAGANGSDESESNGGDIFSEGAGSSEQTFMSTVPEPDVEFVGTPMDPYDAQYMDHVIFGSSKYDDFDWLEKSHPMKVACKFGATQVPFGSSHKNRAKYRGSPPPTGDTLKGGGTLLPSVSMAMDARLEQGLELQVEWYLKVTTLMDAHSVGQTFSGPLCIPPSSAHLPTQAGDLPPTDDALAANMASGGSRRQVEPSTSMLSKCFNQLFGQLQYHRVQLDSLLQLWLQVLEANPDVEKQDNSFDATVVPSIQLNQSSLNKLLASVAWQLNMPVHTWCLAFHALSALANSRDEGMGTGVDAPSMAEIIVRDTNLLPALVHFLSGSALHGTAGSQHYSQVGPTVTQALYEFLSRLQIKLASSHTPNTMALKELLLRLVHILSEPSGAFHTGTGPLDAQVRFLDFVVEQAYGRTEVNSIVSMIDSIALLVHNHITRTQRVAQYTNSDTNVNARSCFGGLFASMLRPGDVRSSGGEASRDVLMCSLLQLVNQLIKVPLDEDSAARFLQAMPRQDITVGADLGSLPVTDSSKLNASMQQSVGNASGTAGPMSDDDKERSSEAQQSATPATDAPAEPQQVPRICDIVLSNKETISMLLSALNHCSSNTMASIIGSSTLYPSASDSFANVDPLSVGDNIFQILCTLGTKAYSVELMLRPLLAYLSATQNKSGCSLSEPLLWFILKILSDQKSLQAFHDMGGVRVVCTNLVVSNRAVIDTSPSTVSAIMQHLGSMSKLSSSISNASRTNRTIAGASAEVENIDGLVNFAPYGSINSSSATAQPAEVLLQPTPPHRRARSAAWSYHFYPDEAWCDLHITLPNAILLREVHIQPHLTSLATCPSSVSLEISADGTTPVPICPPLPTSGLTYVKFQLPRPEITTSVCLRLHRPRDSNTIGLSQVMLLGITAFGNVGNGSQSGLLLSSDDGAAKSSIRWLRLLHHCLTQVAPLEIQIANTASRMPALLTTCSSLLLSPHCQVYAANIEAVILKLGLCCTDVGLTIFDLLLRSSYSTGEEEHSPPMLGHSAGVSSHSTVDIIFQLGTSHDGGTKDRVQALLDWLGDTARVAAWKHSHFHRTPRTLSPAEAGLLNPAPSHVHAVATIIWASHQQVNTYDVASLLTNELFSSVYEWSMVLPLNSSLKRAADFVLCAMCYVQPVLFESLLQWMGISMESGLDMEISLTDDNKDAQEHAVRHSEDNATGLTDDTKGAAANHHQQQQTAPVIDGYVQFPIEEFAHVMLDEAHLSTLAVTCQSETSTERILSSGFPAILAQALAEFCAQEILRNQSLGQVPSPGLTDSSKIKAARSPRSPRIGLGASRSSSESNLSEPVVSLTADLIASVLDFFTELCSQLRMKNWLGSPEGSVFWTPLLTLLCNISANQAQAQTLGSPRKHQVLTTSQRSAVETATITFFAKCITCHQTNQKLLAQVICDVTCSRGTQTGIRFAISGFTRRLILQLMLEDEKLTVFLKASFRLYKSQMLGVGSRLDHPQFGTGHNYKVVEAKLASSCGQLVAQVSDTSSSSLMNDKSKSGKDEVGRSSHASSSIGSSSSKSIFSTSKEPNLLSKMKPKKVAVFDKENNNTSPLLPPHPKHTAPATSKLFMSMPSLDNKDGGLQVPRVHLSHELISTKGLPDNVTLAQLVGVLQQRGMPGGFPMVKFGLNIRKEELDASKTDNSKSAEAEEATKLSDTKSSEEKALMKSLLEAPAIPSFLNIFASLGGLALIAEHLPIVYHDVPRSGGAEESRRDRQSDKWADNVGFAWHAASETWAPMEPVVEDMEQVYEPQLGASNIAPSASASSSAGPVGSTASIPPHSLGAFGLFLRLPGYAEVLLREHKKAQFLLRLVLGVADDGDGGHILSSPQASSLPTLPFTVLVTLFDSTPLTTDDGVLLRRMTLEIGAVHLILACLAVLSHHGPRVSNGASSSVQEMPGPPTQPTGVGQGPGASGEKGSQSYWAKGTGFGTGSTSSGWNVEQALIRQKAEEEHVTCLLKVLSSYINPGGTAWDHSISSRGAAAAAGGASASVDHEPDDNIEQLQNIFPSVFVELLSHSCLIPAISSYLRNDSVLDMARHVPLYCALLQILRALAQCPMLATLLLPQNDDDQVGGSETSVISLLENMKSCVDTYTSRLKLNKEGKPNSHRALRKDTTPEEDADAEGLTQLVPEIQRTVEIVTRATSKLIAASRDEMDREDSDGSSAAGAASKISSEEYYVNIMKKMQFDTFHMITEEDDGKISFVSSHHYASNVKSAGNVTNASRARRLAQEAVTLSNSLPLSASSSVFVRCDEDRLDVMKVLITGPADTPYANGCFEFDVYFPADYPVSPMLVNLETTGQHSVRFNPNLYNDGKVCLSVLNTWHGRPEEKWNAQTSSFLQVLVSIQSLILVSEPYFNEPGYERSRGTPSGTQSSREYDANIMQATVKWAMLEMLRNPPSCFKEVIQTHFYLKRTEVMAQCEEWISQLAQLCNDKRVGRSVAHHWAALKRHTAQLREELMKLKPTKILQEESNKSTQEKTTVPLAEAAGGEAAPMTDSEPAPPLTDNGTTLVKPIVEPKPIVSGIDPLGVGELGNLHNGGEDNAGLY